MLELLAAMPRKKASSLLAGTDFCRDNPDKGSELYKGCYAHNSCDDSYQKVLIGIAPVAVRVLEGGLVGVCSWGVGGLVL